MLFFVGVYFLSVTVIFFFITVRTLSTLIFLYPRNKYMWLCSVNGLGLLGYTFYSWIIHYACHIYLFYSKFFGNTLYRRIVRYTRDTYPISANLLRAPYSIELYFIRAVLTCSLRREQLTLQGSGGSKIMFYLYNVYHVKILTHWSWSIKTALMGL